MTQDVTVQCIAGHVYETDEPNIIERCNKRIEKGYLDAICLSRDECEICKSEKRMIQAKYFDYGISLEDS